MIITEVERLRWRIWNGKAKDAQISIDRIRAVMPQFQGEPEGRRSVAPSRQLWTALHALDGYLTGQSAHLVDYAERHRAGLRVGTALFEYLCGRNAVTHNPVKGVERPKAETAEGKTPAIGDHQARELLAAPAADTLKAKRDRAILSTLLFHALRRDELCKLKVRDFRHARKGVPHLKVSGKGGKVRYLPLHPGTHALIHEYLEAARHGEDDAGALFRPIRNNRTGKLDGAITPDGIYRLVRAYSAALGFEIGAHALRATAATNALDHQADIAKVQGWLGHANIATTRIYDHRRTRPEDSPTFKVSY